MLTLQIIVVSHHIQGDTLLVRKLPDLSHGGVLKCCSLVRSSTMSGRNLLLCAIGKVFTDQSASDSFANT